jgi:hypothetical protein
MRRPRILRKACAVQHWIKPKGAVVGGACLAALLVAGSAGTAYSADYTPVTDARLANPEPANWLMTRGNYKGWSYSSLDLHLIASGDWSGGSRENKAAIWSAWSRSP